MTFWRMCPPPYQSDYEDSYINGSLHHPFGLPGVSCHVCDEKWGSGRALPYECPEALRNHKSILKGLPIPLSEHLVLQTRVMAKLGINGEPFVDLRPGDRFQPSYLDIPSRPRADFLWPGCSLVVSERIKDLLLTFCPSEVAACPVTLRKVGKREAKLPAPMPKIGEPEEMINEVPLLLSKEALGPYFELLPLNESGHPPDRPVRSICPACRREDVDVMTQGEPGDDPNRPHMRYEMWKGQKIFRLATTLWIIITDDLMRALSGVKPANVRFSVKE
jgi:hypothetical protein